jgi:hypothetical protein
VGATVFFTDKGWGGYTSRTKARGGIFHEKRKGEQFFTLNIGNGASFHEQRKRELFSRKRKWELFVTPEQWNWELF